MALSVAHSCALGRALVVIYIIFMCSRSRTRATLGRALVVIYIIFMRSRSRTRARTRALSDAHSWYSSRMRISCALGRALVLFFMRSRSRTTTLSLCALGRALVVSTLSLCALGRALVVLYIIFMRSRIAHSCANRTRTRGNLHYLYALSVAHSW